MKKSFCIFNPALRSCLSNLLWLVMSLTIIMKAGAQCTPPQAETCEEANVLCSLDELNGYACNNPSTNRIDCPLIRKGYNTSWWAFISEGGKAKIKITVGSCTANQGLAYGILGDCLCQEEIITRQNPCIIPNSIDSVTVNLIPCKTYFLWVDGCKGNICDFTINTSGGGRPMLDKLNPINEDPDHVIEPICEGACNVHFFVNPTSGCFPTYVWTLDGDEVGGNSNEINLDFPNEGDFVLCVAAYLGNPNSGSICSQEGPNCSTLKVRAIADKIGIPRTLCNEAVFPLGFKWHSQRIYTSGIYREQFTDGNCCKYDSVVEFIVLPAPVTVEVFHVSCDSTPYVDGLGRSWYGCQYKYPITIQKSSSIYHCDSTILLTSASVSYNPIWEVHCISNEMEISLANVFGQKCKAIDTINTTSYAWYKKEDPNHTILSTASKLKINSIGTYCVTVDFAFTAFSNQNTKCNKTFCYELKSDSLFASFNQLGANKLCIDEIATYQFDTTNTVGLSYEWSTDGNPTIHSMNTIFDKEIIISWHEPGIKTICVRSHFNQNASCLICQKVEVIKAAQAGRDYKVLGYQTKMKPAKVESGKWKLLSGPGKVTFSNSFDPNTKVLVSKVGKYVFEWTATLKGCTDKDSITIDFFKLPFIVPIYNFSNDAEENDFSDFTNRNQTKTSINLFTPNLIQTNGTTFIKLDETFSFGELVYSWMNISGNIILNGKINSESCASVCEILSPVSTGMYFLFIKIEDQKLVRKIIVME